jgi:5-methylcytosine-specific restriction endonuclease McrA
VPAQPARAVDLPRTSAPVARTPRPELSWPSSFDDWMIDIIRRRALRLNSGARRRGAYGTVRAVELGHILERHKDHRGRWICDICKEPVTLTELSFDHVMALADGGRHEAANLVPAHRKCNEIKGSEKAQYRVQAVERWLGEWAATNDGSMPRGRQPLLIASEVERRYA